MGDPGSVPGLERSPREGKGYPFHYSGLENSMNCIVHGVAKSRTRLSDFHFHCHLRDFPDGTGAKEPGCQCKRHRRYGFNSRVRKISWRRKWLPTPAFSPRKFHGQRNLAGYSSWGCKESNTIEVTEHACTTIWDTGPVRINKWSSDSWTPGPIFRRILILSHYHWQAAAFFFSLQSKAKIQFPKFYEKKWKMCWGEKSSSGEFLDFKTLKNLLMI